MCGVATYTRNVAKLLDTYKVSDALSKILDLAKRCNKYIDETMPWALAKDEEKKARLGTVLYNLLEGIRFIAVLLEPFMPETSVKILEQIGTDVNTLDSLAEFGAVKAGDKVGVATPLFSRLDMEKTLAEIEASLPKAEEEAEEEESAKDNTSGMQNLVNVNFNSLVDKMTLEEETKEVEEVDYDEDLDEEVLLYLTDYVQKPNEDEDNSLQITLSNKKYKDKNTPPYGGVFLYTLAMLASFLSTVRKKTSVPATAMTTPVYSSTRTLNASRS